MFERILGIILPVFLVVALGYAYARRAKPDMAWVNRINLNILAPALIFTALSSKDFDLIANQWLILGGVGVVLGSGLLAWPFAKLLHEDPRTFVPPRTAARAGDRAVAERSVRPIDAARGFRSRHACRRSTDRCDPSG